MTWPPGVDPGGSCDGLIRSASRADPEHESGLALLVP